MTIKNGKAQKLRSYILTQKTLLLENVHFTRTINVFNILIWGFGEVFNPRFQPFEDPLSKLNAATSIQTLFYDNVERFSGKYVGIAISPNVRHEASKKQYQPIHDKAYFMRLKRKAN